VEVVHLNFALSFINFVKPLYTFKDELVVRALPESSALFSYLSYLIYFTAKDQSTLTSSSGWRWLSTGIGGKWPRRNGTGIRFRDAGKIIQFIHSGGL